VWVLGANRRGFATTWSKCFRSLGPLKHSALAMLAMGAMVHPAPPHPPTDHLFGVAFLAAARAGGAELLVAPLHHIHIA